MEIIVGGIIEKDNKILMVKEAKKEMLWKMECPCRTFRKWRNNI